MQTQNVAMQKQRQEKDLTIVGLEIRTSNERAFEEIPAHWQKFFQEGIVGQIPNKVSNDVYAVYTNFENKGKNNEGIYSFVIGVEVDQVGALPANLSSTLVPASDRMVFQVETGQPQQVGAKWQEIWGIDDIQKAFIADYEMYKESGEIYITKYILQNEFSYLLLVIKHMVSISFLLKEIFYSLLLVRRVSLVTGRIPPSLHETHIRQL